MTERLSKEYLTSLRSELIIEWNIVGSKIELIDHLLEELPTVEEALAGLDYVGAEGEIPPPNDDG